MSLKQIIKDNGVECPNCFFSEWSDTADSYLCRRYPSLLKKPSSGERHDYFGVYEFRKVDYMDWCGEYINEETGETIQDLIDAFKKENLQCS